MTIITDTTARQILNAIGYTLVAEEFARTNRVPDADLITKKTRKLFELFCESEGIEGVEMDDDEDEYDDFDDVVDESNYDPFSGCDIFEIDEMF